MRVHAGTARAATPTCCTEECFWSLQESVRHKGLCVAVASVPWLPSQRIAIGVHSQELVAKWHLVCADGGQRQLPALQLSSPGLEQGLLLPADPDSCHRLE